MKIELSDYLTIADVGAEFGSNKRLAMRILARAAADGNEVRERLLGRVVIHRRHLKTLSKYHYPRGSAAASAAAKKWGQRGGAAKAANRRLAEAFRAAISGRAESGTAGTEAADHPSASPRRARRAPSG